jgi:hypothetical protein
VQIEGGRSSEHDAYEDDEDDEVYAAKNASDTFDCILFTPTRVIAHSCSSLNLVLCM